MHWYVIKIQDSERVQFLYSMAIMILYFILCFISRHWYFVQNLQPFIKEENPIGIFIKVNKIIVTRNHIIVQKLLIFLQTMFNFVPCQSRLSVFFADSERLFFQCNGSCIKKQNRENVFSFNDYFLDLDLNCCWSVFFL